MKSLHDRVKGSKRKETKTKKEKKKERLIFAHENLI